jgi:archaellum component FlaC
MRESTHALDVKADSKETMSTPISAPAKPRVRLWIVRALQATLLGYAFYVWFIQAPLAPGDHGFHLTPTSGVGAVLVLLAPEAKKIVAQILDKLTQNTAVTVEANQKLNKISSTGEDAQRELHEVREELRTTKSELADLRAEFEKMKTDYRGVHRENNDLRDSAAAKDLEIQDLKKKIATLENRVRVLTTKANNLEKQLAARDGATDHSHDDTATT